MKPKLRSGQLATSSLGYTARNIPLIIGLFLFPALAVVAIELAYVMVAHGDVWSAILRGETGTMQTGYHGLPGYLAQWALYFITMLLLTPGAVRLSRIIAGDIERPGGLWHFSFGMREWRYVGASLLVSLVYIIFDLSLPAGWAQFANGGVLPNMYAILGIPQGLEIWIFLALTILMIWITVKLVPFLPMVAIEDRLTIGRGLGLSVGNFWNILGALILLVLILAAIYIALMIIVAIVAVILIFAVVLASGIDDPDQGTQVGTAMGFAIGFLSSYAFNAFSGAAAMVLATMIYLGIARPKTDQDLIDRLDDTPRKPEDEPDTDDEDGVKRDGETAASDRK
ncbi:hypothetical protein [Aquisalinus flavus]|uniref:Glycerophosphoryl diester phosphodiesterase membrane domain-containing protein n=1 Tax=Aquisalinus flavus TaxID=1526572 RepID=A0A8J2V6N2_9PROT|nr:hypothetical protein [Aquisalinus flavus]MBD0426526.1 hypothetical protein [Aquisalinus flavus]UNE47923.1 hypothetical protein FF099_07620 [Aquisalinus flavus]GGD07260.1 hypothetical protein GCM10011342_15080 [Aquisalinus flavus]